MPLNVRRLRVWFAIAIAALLIVVAGFYFRGYYVRYVVAKAVQHKTEKLGINVQQSADEFTLSKSEGGRTLFTIHASKAVQITSGRAELRDVNIVVYGNEGNRYDQIYGRSFEYDPKTGIVRADGEVHIDLQGVAAGQVRRDLRPPKELQNPIHLKTSGLQFNRNTGIATTDQVIEFRVPQASGSALGATLDSKADKLTLHSEIELQQSGDNGAKLSAKSGTITKDPPRIVFDEAHIARASSDINAQRLTVFLRPDNSIEKIFAQGGVTAVQHGNTDARVNAPQAELLVGPKNQLQSAALTGGVSFEQQSEQPMHGTAGRMLLDFDTTNRLENVHAVDNVHLVQDPPKKHQRGQAMALDADKVDFNVAQHRAETVGSARIVLEDLAAGSPHSNGSNARTVVTASRFVAGFTPRGRLQSLVGSPNARVVSSTPGEPDRVTTSNILSLTMDSSGGLARIVQEGHFRYTEPAAQPGEAGSEATAAKAIYNPQTQMLDLSGDPRVTDNGAATTADDIRVNRLTGDAVAEGSVKTTYSQLKPQPNGALLATSDPIHVTASIMVAHRKSGTADYTGGARLWQGANIVEAPSIDFNRSDRSIVAQGKPGEPVSTVFVQQSQNGKQIPVNVTGARLSYEDSSRQAHFDGGVILRSADATVTADRVTVFLKPRAEIRTGAVEKSASELEKIVADGHVVIQQEGRRGTGDKLVYLAKNASFTLTGGPPSIFDAERGKVTGVSLTFFSHDDRVLVEGGKSAPSVTKARVVK